MKAPVDQVRRGHTPRSHLLPEDTRSVGGVEMRVEGADGRAAHTETPQLRRQRRMAIVQEGAHGNRMWRPLT
jgi:hypothetical protein